ncbi:MAG: endo alpha-1,4 polygalactosaminidase [Actinobacteria bacterium]|nr:endo alpha-1,4 polygalactosaminidase [Actinomycetota bacterium]
MNGRPGPRLAGIAVLVALLVAASTVACAARGEVSASTTTRDASTRSGDDTSSSGSSTSTGSSTTGAGTSTTGTPSSTSTAGKADDDGSSGTAGDADGGSGSGSGSGSSTGPTSGGGSSPTSPRTTPPTTAAPTTAGRIPAGSWQYQLSGTLDLGVDAAIWDVDGDETTAAQVAALHRRGAYVICYMSAGSFEDWRSDAGRYPSSVLGRALDGWPGERWVDVRRTDVLLPIIRDRIARCRAKGFDAVEFDNVDGYANDSGFPLTAAHQLRFNRLLADAAHAQGMHAALKNDADQVSALVGSFDLAVVEECIRYDECDRYRPFTAAGKPVLVVEYDVAADVVCARARTDGFRAIVKDLDLGPGRRAC